MRWIVEWRVDKPRTRLLTRQAQLTMQPERAVWRARVHLWSKPSCLTALDHDCADVRDVIAVFKLTGSLNDACVGVARCPPWLWTDDKVFASPSPLPQRTQKLRPPQTRMAPEHTRSGWV